VKTIQCVARPRATAWLLLALVTVLLASCGKTNNRQPVYPVTGHLMSDGKPASRAVVFFCRLDSHDSHALQPVAKVAADGSFQASTYTANDGAPVGEYALTVIWPDIPQNAPADWDEGPDQLKGRCRDPKNSPWHVRIADQAFDAGTLDLKAWPELTAPEHKPSATPNAPKAAVHPGTPAKRPGVDRSDF
jgi:hypothetical protein